MKGHPLGSGVEELWGDGVDDWRGGVDGLRSGGVEMWMSIGVVVGVIQYGRAE